MPNSNSVPGRSATDTKKDAYLKGKISTVGEIEQRKGVDLFPTMDPTRCSATCGRRISGRRTEGCGKVYPIVRR